MQARLAIIALALLLTASRADTQALPSLRVAYIPFEGAAQVLYAKDEGFFAKEGVAVELQPIPYGAEIASAVASNAVDVGYASIITLAIAHSRQLPFVLIAAANMAASSTKRPAGGLLVLADGPIHTAKDLNGKTLCTAGLGTLTEYAPRAWIDANGGDSSTVKFIEAPFSQIDAAIDAGRCDGGFLTEPFFTPAKHNKRVLAWTIDAISKDYLAAGWFTTASWARSHPDAVRRFAAAMRDAAAWANPEPPAVDDVLASELKVDRSSLNAQVRAAFGERLTPALLQPSIDAVARYQKFPTFSATELIAAGP